MAERGRIGNDEPSNCLVRLISDGAGSNFKTEREAMISSAIFVNFTAMRALRGIVAAAVLATMAAPVAADARTGTVRAGAYDGTWNVMFSPQAGNCHASNSVPFMVSGTRVSSAGGGKVSGGVSRRGMVSVRISVGASWANGNGRLAGNSGAGRWSGIITGDQCSGVWQATRSG
jgi:hypothetical protein